MSISEKEILRRFDEDVAQIEADCEAEGYPSRGSNFDLRYEQLLREYTSWYPEVFGDEDEDEEVWS